MWIHFTEFVFGNENKMCNCFVSINILDVCFYLYTLKGLFLSKIWRGFRDIFIDMPSHKCSQSPTKYNKLKYN